MAAIVGDDGGVSASPCHLGVTVEAPMRELVWQILEHPQIGAILGAIAEDDALKAASRHLPHMYIEQFQRDGMAHPRKSGREHGNVLGVPFGAI